MKKIIALIIAGLMILSFAACGEDTTDEITTEADETTTAADATVAGDEATSDEDASDSAESVAAMYVAAFREIAADKSLTALAMAEMFSEKVSAPMMLGAMDMTEAEYFPGFAEDFVVEGYEDAATYMPMIGSIPFVSYIFVLSEDADAEAFADSLEANANPGWNICVTADETAVDVVDNVVFFIMCPATFEDNSDAGTEELA